MADEPQEMGEITAHAGALALNMGTPGERREQAMLAAGKAANANGIPVLRRCERISPEDGRRAVGGGDVYRHTRQHVGDPDAF